MPEESAWPKLCEVIGAKTLVADERFQNIRGRFKHMPEIVAAIDDALSHKVEMSGARFLMLAELSGVQF